MSATLLRIIALGAVAGMRSVAAVAFASAYLAERPAAAQGRLAVLAAPASARLLAGLAASELVADKLLRMPRVAPLPLAARVASGALAGAAVAVGDGRRGAGGVLAGALTALAAAFGFYRLRRAAGRAGMPEPLAGVVEDGVLLALGARALRR